MSEPELPRVIETMKRRFDAELPMEQSRELWTATRILMGLRYPDEMATKLLSGVMQMRESTTYQAILREGLDQGRMNEARAVLQRIGSRQFGPPASDALARIDAIGSLEKLESLLDRVLDRSANSWDELL